MAKVAQKSPIKSKPLGKKASSSSSSSSSSSDSEDDKPQQKQPVKASATKAPAPSKLPVPAKSTPIATPNNVNDKKRPKESSSSSSESSDDEPVKKKLATSQPIPPVPKQAYPSKVQQQKQNDVSSSPKVQAPQQKQTEIPTPKHIPQPKIQEAPPARQQVNDVRAKTQVTVRVNTNFETPCPHCGHKLEINMNIA